MKGTAWGKAVGSSVPRHSFKFFVLLQKKPVKPSPTFITVVSMTLTQCNDLQAFFSCELFHHYEQKEHKLKIQLKKLAAKKYCWRTENFKNYSIQNIANTSPKMDLYGSK